MSAEEERVRIAGKRIGCGVARAGGLGMAARRGVTGLLVLCLLLTGSLVSAVAGPELGEREQLEAALDEQIARYVEGMGIPGLSVAVGRGDELVYSRSFGADVSGETRFYIGSVSKPFTAVAVVQLAHAGKIDLDQPVSSYVPGFRLSDGVTVRHLLRHRSGMSDLDYIPSLPAGASFDDLLEEMGNEGAVSGTPGGEFAYFNTNYALLGALVEAVSGMSYPEYVEEHILRPLEMENTSVRGVVDAESRLSFFGFSVPYRQPFIAYDLPGGFVTSTPEDLIRFLEAFRTRAPELGASPPDLAEMERGEPYGLGWFTGPVAGRPAVHHGGTLVGYGANAVVLTEDEYSVAFTANKNHMVYSALLYPSLTDGIVSILTGSEPSSRLSIVWIYRGLLLVFLASVAWGVRKRIKRVRSREERSTAWRVRRLVVNLAIPAALLVLIPPAFGGLTGRGMTWDLGFLLMPDVVIWLGIAMAFCLVDAGIHAVRLAQGGRRER